MTEIIHAEHLFDIRRLKADVARAERADSNGYSPSFHRQFQQVLWGNSRRASPEHQEAQRKLTEATLRSDCKILNEIFKESVPPKPKEE